MKGCKAPKPEDRETAEKRMIAIEKRIEILEKEIEETEDEAMLWVLNFELADLRSHWKDGEFLLTQGFFDNDKSHPPGRVVSVGYPVSDTNANKDRFPDDAVMVPGGFINEDGSLELTHMSLIPKPRGEK